MSVIISTTVCTAGVKSPKSKHGYKIVHEAKGVFILKAGLPLYKVEIVTSKMINYSVA